MPLLKIARILKFSRKKGIDVLLLTDQRRRVVGQVFSEVSGKKLQSVGKGQVDLKLEHRCRYG